MAAGPRLTSASVPGSGRTAASNESELLRPWQRDSAYHQGSAWPWLVGPFVDAWLAVRGDTPAERAAVHTRCLAPLLAHLDAAGLGHVSEIADGDAPHAPRGCPFQAWSLGELRRALARVGTDA